jgi:hypothetical protein
VYIETKLHYGFSLVECRLASHVDVEPSRPQYISDAGLPENMQRKLTELPFSATVDLKLLYIILTSTALIGRGVTFDQFEVSCNCNFPLSVVQITFLQAVILVFLYTNKSKAKISFVAEADSRTQSYRDKIINSGRVNCAQHVRDTRYTLSVHTAHA